MNQVILDLQLVCKNTNTLPKKDQFQKWLNATILRFKKKSEITVRITDEQESRNLNLIYRNKNIPTNVLSFPFVSPPGIRSYLLGDLIICRQIVEKEAKEQKKQIFSHWAHVVIHGSLHVLGYHHSSKKKLKEMKFLENEIMISLGYKKLF